MTMKRSIQSMRHKVIDENIVSNAFLHISMKARHPPSTFNGGLGLCLTWAYRKKRIHIF